MKSAMRTRRRFKSLKECEEWGLGTRLDDLLEEAWDALASLLNGKGGRS